MMNFSKIKKYTVQAAGFSLIELMITVMIVGILAAAAYPSYVSYVVKASRQAAMSELSQLANLQEKIYLNSNVYAISVTAAYTGAAAGGLGKTSGKTDDNRYTITVTPSDVAGQTFTLTATPVAGLSQASDGNITISSDGTRVWGSTTW